MDAPVHTTGAVRDYIMEERRLRATHIPTAVPEVSTMGSIGTGKRDMPASEYHSMLGGWGMRCQYFSMQLGAGRFIRGGSMPFKSL